MAEPATPASEARILSEWIDRSVLEAASWRLASELVRRHPLTTRVLHTHPGGGQYDCLTITSPTATGGTIQLNRNGSIQVHQRFDDSPDPQWEPTSWDEYLRADPRAFLNVLERAAGLPTPRYVPPSDPMTIVSMCWILEREKSCGSSMPPRRSRHLRPLRGGGWL